MCLTSLLLSTLPGLGLAVPQTPREEVALRYRELALAGDSAGLEALWKEHVGLVLATIDGDLEGSLALWEKSPEAPPSEEIAALHRRALFGARAAGAAFDEPIFTDYASSFVGWSDAQKHAFRAGQQVFGRAVKEYQDGNHEMAFKVAKETVERASALGDWWGTAMAYGVQGDAARQVGWFEDALVAYGMARQLNHALGLRSSELHNLEGMLAAARAAGRRPRALALATDLAALARLTGNAAALEKALAAQGDLDSPPEDGGAEASPGEGEKTPPK